MRVVRVGVGVVIAYVAVVASRAQADVSTVIVTCDTTECAAGDGTT